MKHLFSVAGHAFLISMKDNTLDDASFYNYWPFFVDASDSLLFELNIFSSEDITDFADIEMTRLGEETPFTWYGKKDGKEFYGFSIQKDSPQSFLTIDEETGTARLYLNGNVGKMEHVMGMNNAVMLLYALFSSLHGTLLLHSSVVMHKGYGYAFLGESGTGKSTHTDLWVNHIPGTVILNDDNPVIRLENGKVTIYGSPWSGKRDFYVNQGWPLKGLVMLEQATYNSMSALRGADAFIALLTSCFCIQWHETMKDRVYDTIAGTVNHCGIHHLQCRPDQEAAVICYTGLNEQ